MEECLPRYDYQCESCGHSFELKLSFDSPTEQHCSECQGVAVRQFSAVPIVFKGSGWYVNDYGKSSGGSTTSAADSKGDAGDKTTNTDSNKDNSTESGTKTTPKPEVKSSTAKEE